MIDEGTKMKKNQSNDDAGCDEDDQASNNQHLTSYKPSWQVQRISITL